MCGIVGYIGQNNAKDFVLEGLKKLEYRGYDSWGIALKEKEKIIVLKETGQIGKFDVNKVSSKTNMAIGHTRWATHGAVNIQNAHPHTDCNQKIAVVHNGIINNYQTLKEDLIKKGHKFLSETDTEVIPHLVEEYSRTSPSLVEAVRRALKDVQGNYAICLLSKDNNQIIAASDGCPLIIGLGKDEIFISSDILAFQGKAKKIIFLKDNSLVQVGDAIEILDIQTGRPKKIIQEDSKTASVNQISNYKHFLIKEISEQPAVLEKIAKIDSKEIEVNAALIRNSYGTFTVACGTAFHAALVGVYLFAKFSKMHLNATLASEFPQFESFLTSKTLLMPISQSGETADVLEAVKSAKAKNVKILSILNNSYSTLARISNEMIITPAGPEIAVLSTKAFTAQVGILFLLSTAYSHKTSFGYKIIKKVSKEIASSLSKESTNKIQILAKKLKNSKNLFAIGRALNYPTAMEAALKIKEVSYIHAEGFAGGELKHGTIALIEKDTPCLVFVANDATKDEILSNAEEIKARGGYIIGIAPEENIVFDYFIKVADIPEISPIVNIIPIQVLAYYLALERGLDPDKPRNLAKSVTVK